MNSETLTQPAAAEDKGSIFFPRHDTGCDIVCTARIKTEEVVFQAEHFKLLAVWVQLCQPPNIPVASSTNTFPG